MSLPLKATHRGRPVTAGHATPAEVAALVATSPLEAAIDVLEHWSLIAIRGLGGGGTKVHALGWRQALANTWITSSLVAVDVAVQATRTRSGHVYALGRREDPGRMHPELADHLDYALRKWGFVDLRWRTAGGAPPGSTRGGSAEDVGDGGCGGR